MVFFFFFLFKVICSFFKVTVKPSGNSLNHNSTIFSVFSFSVFQSFIAARE